MREEPSSIVTNLEQSMLDVNVAVGLIELCKDRDDSMTLKRWVNFSRDKTKEFKTLYLHYIKINFIHEYFKTEHNVKTQVKGRHKKG